MLQQIGFCNVAHNFENFLYRVLARIWATYGPGKNKSNNLAGCRTQLGPFVNTEVILAFHCVCFCNEFHQNNWTDTDVFAVWRVLAVLLNKTLRCLIKPCYHIRLPPRLEYSVLVILSSCTAAPITKYASPQVLTSGYKLRWKYFFSFFYGAFAWLVNNEFPNAE